MRGGALRLFGIPALIATVSLIGLVAGLLGDGLPDVLAGVALAVPVAVIGYALAKARSGGWDRR